MKSASSLRESASKLCVCACVSVEERRGMCGIERKRERKRTIYQQCQQHCLASSRTTTLEAAPHLAWIYPGFDTKIRESERVKERKKEGKMEIEREKKYKRERERDREAKYRERDVIAMSAQAVCEQTSEVFFENTQRKGKTTTLCTRCILEKNEMFITYHIYVYIYLYIPRNVT